ncbi:MAG: Transglutaminase-like enzyme putative cysteine protease [Chthoniobacteraceae bacterium]|nr:Transglutaminase-like enzyme putative cysteine protease [Chthoniobacteraceae bacterium]
METTALRVGCVTNQAQFNPGLIMHSSIPKLDLAVRVGCELVYDTAVVTPVLLAFKPRQDLHQKIRQESINFEPFLHATEFEDDHQNIVYRLNLQPGRNTLRYDAIVMVPSTREDFMRIDEPIPPHLLPPSILRYTLPTRYCDSDKLLDFAWQHFGHLPHGLARVQAICDWLHHNIEYRTGSGSPNISAHDVITRGYGVCRDFAHTALALCRTFNIPARYVSGYVPDIGCEDPGSPMDFHAYIEVYLGGQWQVFDARFNAPRTGRIRICTGYDAVNCAFTTIYGSALLSRFDVWSYQVDPREVRVDDPIDMSRRLCGSPEIRLPKSDRQRLELVRAA